MVGWAKATRSAGTCSAISTSTGVDDRHDRPSTFTGRAPAVQRCEPEQFQAFPGSNGETELSFLQVVKARRSPVASYTPVRCER